MAFPSLDTGSSAGPLPPWKRGLDLAFCLLAVVPLALATLFMTALRALLSPGPVFYRQERVGYLGRRFYCYKFRTMKMNTASSSHQAHFKALISNGKPMLKLDGERDSRLNVWTRIFRASGCDELPQVINILRGEMSLVGPRPCLPTEFEQFNPHQRRRCEAVPGLTGLWQVSGKNRTTFDQMIDLDLAYIGALSLRGDLRIVASTPRAVLADLREFLRQHRTPHEKPGWRSHCPAQTPLATQLPSGTDRTPGSASRSL